MDPMREKRRRALAYHVCDWLVRFAGEAPSREEWARAFRGGDQGDATERAWERLRARFAAEGVPHRERVEQGDWVRVELLEGAEQWADEVLGVDAEADETHWHYQRHDARGVQGPTDEEHAQRFAEHCRVLGDWERQLAKTNALRGEWVGEDVAREWLRCAARGSPYPDTLGDPLDVLALARELGLSDRAGRQVPKTLGVSVGKGGVDTESAKAALEGMSRERTRRQPGHGANPGADWRHGVHRRLHGAGARPDHGAPGVGATTGPAGVAAGQDETRRRGAQWVTP